MSRALTKARDIGIILGILDLIVGVISLGYAVIQSNWGDTNLDSGKAITYKFVADSGDYKSNDKMEPSKGWLYYSWKQTKGTSNCKYTLSYKKTSAASFDVIISGKTFSKNNKYTDYKYLRYTNGKVDYNIRATKTAGKSTTSKLVVAWLINYDQ